MFCLKNKLTLTLVLLATSFSLRADYLSWEELTKKAESEGISPKLVSHVQCFIENYEQTSFRKKYAGGRCGSNTEITLDSKRVVAIIDYTAPSNEQRMFLLDRKTGGISHMAVAHGRYEAGFINQRLSHNKNSVKHARYFSNEKGSNAPSSGFFIADREYEGKFGRSLVLHGLEHGINDNACERAVVIHKHKLMTKNKAYVLSSGCPMVAPSYIDHVIEILKGNNNGQYGSLVFIHGNREAQWEAGTCDGNFNF